MAPEFKDYQLAVLANARSLCARLQHHGYTMVSGGTENHLVLVDLKPNRIDGSRVQQVLDEVCPPNSSVARGWRGRAAALHPRHAVIQCDSVVQTVR